MTTSTTISPRFQRIAAWVREHGFTATAGESIHTGQEFVDIEIPYTHYVGGMLAREHGFTTERAYSKADAARILGY